MAEFANLSSSFPEQTNGQCRGLVAQNVFLGVVCFLGITTNSVLLAFIWKYRHGTLTPDKMLLMNYAAVDLIACLVSLPLHITALNGSLDLANNDVCLARFFTMFTCFAVNIMTLATIAVDRYDAICLAPNRKITCKKTAYYLVFIWLFSCCTVVAGGTGHILTAFEGGYVCNRPGREIHTQALTGKTAMLAVVTLWIVPSLCIIFYRFHGIVKYVREYSSHLRSVLGTSRVQKEVKLTKICVAMVVTYFGSWLLFAIMVGLRNSYSSLAVHCTYLWAYSLAYSSFTVVPVEYMILDRRFRSSIWRKRRRRSRKVSPNHGGGSIHLQVSSEDLALRQHSDHSSLR